jgi:hypothetical protein
MEEFEITRSELRDNESLTPILHNKHVIYLQGLGFSINLYPDGKWVFEDTTGG